MLRSTLMCAYLFRLRKSKNLILSLLELPQVDDFLIDVNAELRGGGKRSFVFEKLVSG